MIEHEFTDAPLADKRLAHRLVKIAAMAVTDPAASFPQIARSDGELEGIYRFLNIIGSLPTASSTRTTARRSPGWPR